MVTEISVSPTGCAPSRLRPANEIACTSYRMLTPPTECHWIKLSSVDKPTKIGCHGNVPWGIEKLISDWSSTAVVLSTVNIRQSSGSLPPGLWLTSPADWLSKTGISSGTLRSVFEYGLPLPFYGSMKRFFGWYLRRHPFLLGCFSVFHLSVVGCVR